VLTASLYTSYVWPWQPSWVCVITGELENWETLSSHSSLSSLPLQFASRDSLGRWQTMKNACSFSALWKVSRGSTELFVQFLTTTWVSRSNKLLTYCRSVIGWLIFTPYFAKETVILRSLRWTPANIRINLVFARNCDPWATLLLLTVWVYLHSNFFVVGSERDVYNVTDVVDFGINRERVCNFLLAINSNLGPILQYLRRFGDTLV